METFELQANENITSLQLFWDNTVDRFVFSTDQGRTVGLGKPESECGKHQSGKIEGQLVALECGFGGHVHNVVGKTVA